MKSIQSGRTNLSVRFPNLRRISLVLGAAGVLAGAPSAFAQYDANAFVGGLSIGSTTTPGDVSYSFVDGTERSAVVTFTSSPIASISYAATAFNPLGQIVLGGGGVMTYRFEVEAQPFTNVPIDFSGLYSSFVSAARADTRAATSFSIQTVNSSVSTYASFDSLFQGDCGASICLQHTIFNNITLTYTESDAYHVDGSFDGTFDMLTGADGRVIGSVRLSAGANINAFFVSSSANAFIDPHLEIDAAFLAANPGSRLTITPGVGNEIANVSAVPEPSSYALMLVGLAAMGVSVRRARRS